MVSYASSGVDIAAGEKSVDKIRASVASVAGPQVLGAIGDFAGAFAFDHSRFAAPVLVASTDGVGTKVLVAQALQRYDTVGIDLVAMCVDDLVCMGAEPLFFLDYIATGTVDPDQVEQLVRGVVEGCRQVGCALLGGETAEHPGTMTPGQFDLAGFAVGVVDKAAMLGAARVTQGDVLVGLASPGLRSNGYSLARHVLLERAGLSLDAPAWDGADHTMGDELLRPSVLYTPAVLAATRQTDVHAVAHITGGGMPGNLARVLPAHCDALVDTGAWDVPRIFGEIQRLGDVDPDEMARVFNLGIGMVVVAAPGDADTVVDVITGAGVAAMMIGHVVEGSGQVQMSGS